MCPRACSPYVRAFLCVCVCVCVSWPLPPSLFHPSFESVCDIQSSNCQVWPRHSSPQPAYQHCVTLTTANYHRDGDLGFTVALWEYRYISFHKLPPPTTGTAPSHTHTHTHTTCPRRPLLLLPHVRCSLTDVFTTTLLRLPQDGRVVTAPNVAKVSA